MKCALICVLPDAIADEDQSNVKRPSRDAIGSDE